MLLKSIKKNTGSCHLLTLSMVTACLLVASCSSDDSEKPGSPDIGIDDVELRLLIGTAGITGDPTTGRTLPSVMDAKARLGKKLFFTKGLGGNDDSACVTCHHPVLGGGDDLSLSIGVNAETPDLLGPGRVHDQIKAAADNNSEFDGGPPVPRNAPTTFNIALWNQALFHDGRVERLSDGTGIRTPDSDFGVADKDAGDTLAAAQSRFPITSPEEMRGFTFQDGTSNAQLRTALVEKLTATGVWGDHFAMAYDGDGTITHQRIAEAIGEYERSQVFVDTPWKAFVEGDASAISESAKRGATLFFSDINDGGANCTSCHSGDFFTDEQYHVMATPQIGRGKGNDNGTISNDDFGRARESSNPSDKYKFRTPTLLNVEVTGPWSHAGAYTALEAMVRHMLDPEQAIANYDMGQLDANANLQTDDMAINTQFALDQLIANRANNVSGVHQIVEFTEDDVSDLVEFLNTLTDPCVKDRACLSPWIPRSAGVGPDGLKLNAVDSDGALL